MANISKFTFFNHLVAGITTIAFTTSIIQPQNVQAVGINLDVNGINFGVRVEKVFEKIKKSVDKGETNKIVSYMFDIKSEVESYTGQPIDIGKQLEQVQREAKAKGQKIDEKQLRKIKKDFEQIDKKHKHRSVWMANCMECDIPYTSSEADFHFDNLYIAKHGHDKDKKDEEVYIPVTITVGVTLSLCGLFLLLVPIPICKTSGLYLLEAGIGALGWKAVDKWDEYDRKKHEEEKEEK